MAERRPSLISFAEIADLAKVERPVATTWARRYKDFPKPISRDHGRPLFDSEQVVSWLLETGRGKADPGTLRAELALHSLSAWRDRLPASALVATLTSLICLRHHLDAPLSTISWDALVQHAARVDFDDAYLLTEVITLFPETGTELAGLTDDLVDAAYTPGEAFEWVLDKCHHLGAGQLVLDEPAPLVSRMLAQLSGAAALSEGSIVATPYARTGGLLASVHEQAPEHSLLAADPDPAMARLARRRMFVRGLTDLQFDVADGHEPNLDGWGDPDLVVCVLPYEPAETRRAHPVLTRIADLIDWLDQGRVAVVLGPADALAHALAPHEDADLLRRWFLTEGLLKAVVTLPEGVFRHRPGYRTAVWVLSRTPEERRTGLVLLADLSSIPLSEQSVDTLMADVDIFRAAHWREDNRHAIRHGVILPVQVLNDRPGTALTPRHRPRETRHTEKVRERPARIAELEIEFAKLMHQEPAELRIRAIERQGDQAVRTSVARMLKERRVRKIPGHRVKDEHLSTDGDLIVITPEEVLGRAPLGAHRTNLLAFTQAFEHGALTRPGDIVITANPELGALVDSEGSSVVAFPARILRTRPDAERPVRPRVLAALLRAAAAEHRRVEGALRVPRRLEELLIPELSPDEAERYDTLLAEIDRLGSLLQRQAATLAALDQLTAAGMADGTLTIT
ncbi:N-6 DNA methylase [Nonomuraea sp. NPDC049607]|uniref:N-6 DNA methylase n=1 Tax=Nonomuraea sp. NPDC049607 TaxID=3154732 RepID=UPI00343DACFC